MNKDFDLLDDRKDRLLLILTCFLFIVIFFNIFVPFNSDRWRRDTGIMQFIRFSSYGAVPAMVFLFTQFPLRKWFGIACFKVKTYLLWLFIEISLMSLIFVLIYDRKEGGFFNDFIFSFRQTFLGLLIPYAVAMLILYNKNQRVEIKKLRKNFIRVLLGDPI